MFSLVRFRPSSSDRACRCLSVRPIQAVCLLHGLIARCIGHCNPQMDAAAGLLTHGRQAACITLCSINRQRAWPAPCSPGAAPYHPLHPRRHITAGRGTTSTAGRGTTSTAAALTRAHAHRHTHARTGTGTQPADGTSTGGGGQRQPYQLRCSCTRYPEHPGAVHKYVQNISPSQNAPRAGSMQ